MTIRNRRQLLAPFLCVCLGAALVPVTAVQAAPSCRGRAATIIGTRKSDYLVGTPRSDVIVGRKGHDHIIGRGGKDVICAGRGDDYLLGNAGNDRLFGERGSDFMLGHGGNDTLTTGPGRADIASGGPGNDRFVGNEGLEVANYLEAERPVTVDLAAGTGTGEGTDTFLRFSGVIGSAHADTLAGTGGTNLLIGAGGADNLASGGNSGSLEKPRSKEVDILVGDGDPYAEPADDVIEGGGGLNVVDYSVADAGIDADLQRGTIVGEGTDEVNSIQVVVGTEFDDTLLGDQRDNAFRPFLGNDTVDGRQGTDVAVFTTAPRNEGITVNLPTGAATGEGIDNLSAIENIWGSFGPDDITADSGDNVVFAFRGADRLSGGDGDDILNAGKGPDTIDGGAGQDRCTGGETVTNCEEPPSSARTAMLVPTWLRSFRGYVSLTAHLIARYRELHRL